MNLKRGITRTYVVLWIGWAAALAFALFSVPNGWLYWLGFCVVAPTVLLVAIHWIWAGFFGPPGTKP